MSLRNRPTRPMVPFTSTDQEPVSEQVGRNVPLPAPIGGGLPGNEPQARTQIFLVKTKIAGTTHAPVGQKALAMLQAAGQEACDHQYKLVLKTDWSNQFDSDAILVFLQQRNSTPVNEVRLGYLPNKERICTVCGEQYPATTDASNQVQACARCNSPVSRFGVASTVSQYLRLRNPDIPTESQTDVSTWLLAHIAWEAGGVTGGNGLYFGCNVRVQAAA